MRFMIVAFVLGLALPAAADPCRDEIAALFANGPLDAYQRPPHRHEKQVFDASGALTLTFSSIVETPLRSISGIKGGDMTLTIDDDTWTGPSPDGPWAPSQNNMPKDREPWHRAMQAQQAANLSDTACPGIVDFDGHQWLSYRFSTRTDPNPAMGNAFYGSSDTVHIDPETRQVMRWEQTGLYSSWLPEPGKDTYVTTFSYDPGVRVTAPQ